MNGHTEGFSMIELIMALVIAGITIAIALPKITNVSEVDIYSAVRQVKSDIRYTQELAMSKYRMTTITFDSTSSNPSTYTITSSAGPTLDRKLPPRSKVIFDSSSQLSFIFNSFGEPITGFGGPGGGTLTLKFTSGGPAFTEQVDVYNITGQAHIP